VTTVEVLRAARARIETSWVQADEGGYVGSPNYCALLATSGLADSNKEWQADEYVQRAIGTDSATGVAGWNDAPGRTREEVIEAFDKAIALAEADTSRDAAGMK
jgi:hypothetical protein